MPDEVLGLIYAQTVVWVGSFFCPLLPLLNTVKFLLLFYLKKVRGRRGLLGLRQEVLGPALLGPGQGRSRGPGLLGPKRGGGWRTDSWI